MKETELEERLLAAWLTLSSCVRNNRLVKTMSFNEIFACHILHRQKDSVVTATEIVRETGMLKSQVNKVLTDLEKKGFIQKVSFPEDKRKIGIMLTKTGEDAYNAEHTDVLLLLKSLRLRMGDEKVNLATDTLEDLAENMRMTGREK